jgi:hypothetical protein
MQPDLTSCKWHYAPQLTWTLAKIRGSRNSSLPPAWAELVWRQRIYVASSFTIALCGVLLWTVAPWARAHVASGWPWELFGALWLVQGIGSFFADVVNLGRRSIWHALDTQLALLSLVVVFVYGIVFVMGGFFGFAPDQRLNLKRMLLKACCFAITAGAFFAKAQSGAASAARQPRLYFFWHASWHYAIALGLCATLTSGFLTSQASP